MKKIPKEREPTSRSDEVLPRSDYHRRFHLHSKK
jgi:hypothetical protein